MLEYVYVAMGRKVFCSAKQGSLPNFALMGETKESYYLKMLQHEEYSEWFDVQNTKRIEYEHLFYKNLELFIASAAKILSNPRFASILWPSKIMIRIPMESECLKKITLGELLAIYVNEPRYSTMCPKCGCKMYLIYFDGSLHSGSVLYVKYVCGTCKEFQSHFILSSSINDLRRIRNNYFKKFNENHAFHITQLIDYLKSGKIPNRDANVNHLPKYQTNACLRFEVFSKKPLKCFLKRNGIRIDMISNYDKETKMFRVTVQEYRSELRVQVPLEAWTPEFKPASKESHRKALGLR